MFLLKWQCKKLLRLSEGTLDHFLEDAMVANVQRNQYSLLHCRFGRRALVSLRGRRRVYQGLSQESRRLPVYEGGCGDSAMFRTMGCEELNCGKGW